MEPEYTPKARQTREQIVEAALALFAEKGYDETTLRDIAARAGVSLGLTYRYFARKEELVLALYERMTADVEARAANAPAAPISARLGMALRETLERLQPHRDALGALFGAGLAPNSTVAVLGERITPLRSRVWQTYLSVVTGASDAPRAKQARDLATLLYAAHLLLILFWLQDRSPGQSRTRELLEFGLKTFARLRPALALFPVARSLARLARILSPMFGPGSPADE